MYIPQDEQQDSTTEVYAGADVGRRGAAGDGRQVLSPENQVGVNRNSHIDSDHKSARASGKAQNEHASEERLRKHAHNGKNAGVERKDGPNSRHHAFECTRSGDRNKSAKLVDSSLLKKTQLHKPSLKLLEARVPDENSH